MKKNAILDPYVDFMGLFSSQLCLVPIEQGVILKEKQIK